MKESVIIKKFLDYHGFEVVDLSQNEQQIQYIGRVRVNKVNGFLSAMEGILKEAQNNEWSIDVSKMFILKDDKLVHAWRIIYLIKGVDISDIEYCHILKTEHPEVEVVKLPGWEKIKDRNAPSDNGRGVRPVRGGVQ